MMKGHIGNTNNSFRYELVKGPKKQHKLIIKGVMDHTCAGPVLKSLLRQISSAKPQVLHVDLAQIERIEDLGFAVLAELKAEVERWKGKIKIYHMPREYDRFFQQVFSGSGIGPSHGHVKAGEGVIATLGEAAIRHLKEMRFLISFAGSVAVALLYALSHRRSVKEGEIIKAISRVGIEGIPIIVLISFLMGLIMAFMSSVQLRQFGANIYVASLVALAMVRELGPIITAVIVGGRSGSSFAAEIATMKVSEEVDALLTMGFEPTRFLVIPKLIATVIALPILTLLSDFAAIFGGLLVGITMLDLTLNAYLVETVRALTAFDVAWSLFKSAAFAVLITWIGCFRGFQARGGAESVGRATTSAVVSSIFLIILVDSVFAVIITYWG